MPGHHNRRAAKRDLPPGDFNGLVTPRSNGGDRRKDEWCEVVRSEKSGTVLDKSWRLMEEER
jgi:hypothetical protein